MRKLFTLAAAVLASFSMWAADPAPVDNPATKKYGDITFLDVAGTDANRTDKEGKEYLTYGVYYVAKTKAITTWFNSSDGSPASNHETTGYSITDAADFGFFPTSSTSTDINYGGTKCHSGRQRYFYVTGATSVAGIVRDGGTSSNKYAQMLIQTVAEDGTLGSATTIGDTYVANNAGYVLDGGELDPAKYYKISFTSPASSNCYMYQIRLGKTANCTDPELTVSPTEGTGFVGDAIDINITSKNQSKPINAAVTVDGVAGVSGTDYTFKVSTGLVQATPLKAGTFVITFTQASNGTYCDAEESATFVISAKDPVTSFTVEGPTEARVGDEITLTATNFNASPTRVWWLNPSTGDVINEGATYTFTATEAGEVGYLVLARNNYNNSDEEASDYAFGMFGSVTVTLGTDATLSDLKVNGATIDGFAADKYEYNVELGVYEALNVEATAADAPYASAEVVDNGEGKITITVTAQNKSTQAYVINYTRGTATELATISASATWDFTKTGAKEIKFTDETLVKKGVTEFNFADVLTSPDASFNAAALNGIGEYAVREGKYFQGSYLKFQTTVPGKLEVIYCNTGNRDADKGLERILTVNGTKIGEGALRSDTDVTESDIAINAGSVEISSVLKSDESIQYIRVKKVTFTKDEATALDNTEASVKAVKFFQNGQLFIEKNGKVYTIIGSEIR